MATSAAAGAYTTPWDTTSYGEFEVTTLHRELIKIPVLNLSG